MTLNPQDDELLRSYLLGELPSQEADLLERRLLEDDDLFELCEALETDLLAASDRGELAPAEKERVLARLASSPQGRERLAFARSLNTVADEISVAAPAGKVVPFKQPVAFPRTTFRRAALAIAAGLFAVIGVSWFLLQSPVPGGSHRQVVHQRPQPTRPDQPAAPGGTGAPKGAPATTEPADHLARKEPLKAVLTLSLATLRGGGETEEFRIPAGTEVVEIQLFDIEALENPGPFHTVIRSKAGGTVWQGDLAPRQLSWGPVLMFTIPAERLAAGRYAVTVTAGGEEMIQDFEVVRGGRR